MLKKLPQSYFCSTSINEELGAVVPKDKHVYDLLRTDETVTNGSAGVFHIPVELIRASNYDDERVFMEPRLSMDGRVNQG